MPKAVLEYVAIQDFNFVLAAQKNINDAYIADMAKYVSARNFGYESGIKSLPLYAAFCLDMSAAVHETIVAHR